MSESRFFYEGAGRRSAVDALFESIHGVEGLLLLCGPAGSGRTTVLERFRNEADPGVLAIAWVVGDILMSPEQCLDALCVSLGAPVGSEGPVAALGAALAEINAQGRYPVVVVDDAHELGEETLAAVFRFCRDREDPLPLIMAGDETLEGAIDPDVARVRISLGAFSEDESEDYIAAWLSVEDEDELPSHRTVARLHRQARGLPGNLEDLLRSGEATPGRLLPAGFPLWHVVLASTAVALLVALYLAFGAPGAAPVPAPMPEPEVAIALPAPDMVTEAPAIAPSSRLTEVAVPDTAPLGDPNEHPVALPPPAPVATAAGQKPVAVAAPAAPSRTSAAGAPSAARYTTDEQFLLKQKSSRYTLQLFASFNRGAVDAFREKHKGVTIRLFRTVREDLPWYVAVTGDFRNKDDAKKAEGGLPADLRALKPWARSFQGIQDELRRRPD